MKWTKEYIKEYNREYRIKNRERIIAQKRNRYNSDPERFRNERRQWRLDHPYRTLQTELRHQAKCRATKQGLPFDISPDDIVIPEFCPVLGIKLERNIGGHAHDASPSLDRIEPVLGYVKGNIGVISHRANSLKNNFTLDELKRLLVYMQK